MEGLRIYFVICDELFEKTLKLLLDLVSHNYMSCVSCQTLLTYASVLLNQCSCFFAPLLIFRCVSFVNEYFELVERKAKECGIGLVVRAKLIKPLWVANCYHVTFDCLLEV